MKCAITIKDAMINEATYCTSLQIEGVYAITIKDAMINEATYCTSLQIEGVYIIQYIT